MAESFDTIYFRGQGKLFIGLRNTDGSDNGLIFVGDIESADGTPNVEREQIIENVTGSSGIAAEFVRKVEYSLTINMRSAKPAHLAMALQASNTAKAGSSVTDEEIVAHVGKFTPLEHTNVESVVVKSEDGGTTYTENTDYIVHAADGMIEIPDSGSTITDEETIKVSYSYAAQHHLAANPQNQEYRIVFAGLNAANNSKKVRCEIYRAKLSPSVLGFIQQNAVNFPLTGTILQDSSRPAGDQFYSWKLED